MELGSGSTIASTSSGRRQQQRGVDPRIALALLTVAAHKDPAAVASLRPARAFVQLVASAASRDSRSAALELMAALLSRLPEQRAALAASGALAVLLDVLRAPFLELGEVRFAATALSQLLRGGPPGIAKEAAAAGVAPVLLDQLRCSQCLWTNRGHRDVPGRAQTAAFAAAFTCGALGDLVQADPRVAPQLLEADAAPLLVSLIRPPDGQALAHAQRGGWAEELEEVHVAAAGVVRDLGHCSESEGGEAEAARHALRAAGVMGALLGLLKHLLQRGRGGNNWPITAEAAVAMMDFEGAGARDGRWQLLGPDDDAVLEVLLQALLHAPHPKHQEVAARKLHHVLIGIGSSRSGGAGRRRRRQRRRRRRGGGAAGAARHAAAGAGAGGQLC